MRGDCKEFFDKQYVPLLGMAISFIDGGCRKHLYIHGFDLRKISKKNSHRNCAATVDLLHAAQEFLPAIANPKLQLWTDCCPKLRNSIWAYHFLQKHPTETVPFVNKNTSLHWSAEDHGETRLDSSFSVAKQTIRHHIDLQEVIESQDMESALVGAYKDLPDYKCVFLADPAAFELPEERLCIGYITSIHCLQWNEDGTSF